ncbi:ABC transporter ATP-binding protein/permease [Tissierella pigra]|uniref:ABC transporter ATP-binding protein n=1 Tax=Tissierella pigra TaxID=2607614 RepID=A0A6N7XHV5_9FIRM|nr:ABC transporter ATP-binding protein [Tissierella pigra]MBU5428307.1 ABC transporter ATP-binding protein/permease [Tissierella pigra]MSU01631.1 ABC transporter ATP-binding protein [Tissierella pigra]
MKKDIQILKFGLKEIHILQPWVIPVTIINSFFKSIMPFINIYMSSKIIDELLRTKDVDRLIFLVGITIGLNLIIHLLSTGFGHLKGLLARIMWQNQDMRINEKIISMDYQHVENPETHILRTKITEGESMNGGGVYALVNYFDELITGLVTLFTSIILIMEIFKVNSNVGESIGFINSTIFNMIFIAILVICTIYNLKLKENSQNKFFNSFNRMISYNRMFFFYYDQISDYNSGKSVRLYHQQPLLNKKSENMCNGFHQILNEIISDNIKYGAANGFISSLLSGLVYIFVGLKAMSGSITIGNIVKYTGSINQFMAGSGMVLMAIVGLKANNQYLQLYMDFLNIEGEKYKGTLPVEKRDDDEYEIEFRNVSFKYPKTNNYVLKNISMKLNIGERLAIVGMNGSGKTTFIKLLCRLYDPDEGEILLNGIDIKKYDYDEYLNLFSIVFQDFKLFSFSLGQNVAASVDYNISKVEDILIKAGLKERLATLSKGVETPLYKDFDEDGVEISGGEAQKIALARALYRNAPIIILDEPTSALDPIAEFEIYSKFNELVGTKTAFYISHRLSSCRFCDEIAVFHEGRIVQKGNHESLLKDIDGKYYELWNSQAQYYNEEAM